MKRSRLAMNLLIKNQIKMGIFSRNKKIDEPVKEERSDGGSLSLLFNGLTSFSESKALKLAAWFCGVEQISNSVGMLPFSVVSYDLDEKKKASHPLNKILSLRPNSKDTPFFLFKGLVEQVIMKGAGYILIQRDDKLNVVALHPIDNAFVQPMLQADGSVKYIIEGVGTVESSDVIDVALHRDEMYHGISLLKYASMTLKNSYDIEETSGKYFRGGMGLNGVISSSSVLNKDQRQSIRNSWREAFSKDGSGVVVLPQGLSYSAISDNPKDSMLIESKEFGLQEICRYLNISPIRVFQLQETSYASMEATNLSFLSDTVKPYVVAICEEFNLKLFKPSEIGKYAVEADFTSAMQTNKQAEAEYLRTMLTNGVLTLNEIRASLGYPKVEGDCGNTHWIQISYADAEKIADGAYIKAGQQDKGQEVNNQTKVKD